eukprot:scaffold16912_cov112-Isochrysis_galbana.AAC.6
MWLLAYWCEEIRVARRRRDAAPKGEVGCGTLLGGEARAVGTGTKGWGELALSFGTGAGALNIERAGHARCSILASRGLRGMNPGRRLPGRPLPFCA